MGFHCKPDPASEGNDLGSIAARLFIVFDLLSGSAGGCTTILEAGGRQTLSDLTDLVFA